MRHSSCSDRTGRRGPTGSDGSLDGDAGPLGEARELGASRSAEPGRRADPGPQVAQGVPHLADERADLLAELDELGLRRSDAG